MSDGNDLKRLFESLGTPKNRKYNKDTTIDTEVGTAVGSIVDGSVGAANCVPFPWLELFFWNVSSSLMQLNK